ncbi:MAG TPA: hypothetical protein VNI52_13115 [Sphingobacteriaceae bacterium]|nr:hypothetical protein [Sphingobacteriaceae bacterium]
MSKELRKVKANFKKWNALLQTYDNISWETAHSLLKKFDIRIPRLVIHNITHSLKLYRVRAFSQESAEDISDPRTFSYPPNEKVKTFQRANIPYHTVFYGAFDGKTAFEELKLNGNQTIKRGDIIFLSEWTIKEGSQYNLAQLTLPEISEEEQLYGDLTKKVYSEINRIFDSESAVFAEEQKFLYQQASKIFLSGSYIQSGILAHQILYKTPEVQGVKIDGILYPSFSNNFRSINCALHPDFVDKNLRLESIRKLSFEEFTDEGAQTVSQYFGEVQKGKIIWKTYFSELFVKTFSTKMELSEEWSEDERINARFFVSGRETNIKEYCHSQVDSIDLSKSNIPGEHEAAFRANEDFVFVFEQHFDPGISYLKYNDRINDITIIRWKIPLKASTREVKPLEVYNSKTQKKVVRDVNS